MEQLAYTVRTLAFEPGEKVVISFRDTLTDEQREKVYQICEADLDLNRAQVLILEADAHVTTELEALKSMAVLLADAEKCLAGLIGVAQHSEPHRDSTVAERDQRIVEYSRGSIDLIRLFLAENEQPKVREPVA